MQLKQSIFFFLILCNICIQAQNEKELDTKSFKESLKNEFTQITGASKNSLNQGASINTAEGIIAIEYSFLLQDDENENDIFDIMNIKLQGGSSDGLFNIFTNSKFNSNISLSLDYQLINYSGSTIRRIDLDGEKIVSGVKINWFSAGYTLKHESLNLLNQNDSSVNQVLEENNISHEFSLSFNMYEWKKYDGWDYYFSPSISYGYTNNSARLDKVEVYDVIDNGDDDGKISLTNKVNALKGDYQEGLHNLNIAIDFYLFPFKKEPLAFHLFPKYQIIEDDKPILNTDIGVLVPFTKKSSEKSVVNLELFYRFLDIGNTTKSTYKLFERNNIGFRVTFPINFKNI